MSEGAEASYVGAGDLGRYLNACRKHEVQPNSSILSSCLKGIEMLSLGSFRIGAILLVNGLNVSCPSCGRTLFDLQEISAQIREKTSHLPGVSIAIMGCIVNRPGEMADADFGYVGGAPGKIDLYMWERLVKRRIAMEQAIEALIQLIKDHRSWVDPPADE
ncbi:hypothetical protein J5N97_012775 [Dioscorea zingiberensis]|uniref:IspG C-terminal domain-containing protein n=1 Tax=Dioscorea zingiberensis TaxID=325984 RepID=A0A9D5CPJ5_9LILI|nr:hypothetical protein J5N97_012775 [Dioscorea zingiberensis]